MQTGLVTLHSDFLQWRQLRRQSGIICFFFLCVNNMLGQELLFVYTAVQIDVKITTALNTGIAPS